MAAFGDRAKSWDNVAVLVDETIKPQAPCSPFLQTPTRQNIKPKATLIRNKNTANRQSAPEQRIRKGEGYSLSHVAEINPVERPCASMPLSVKAATPNVRHRKPKKQFIEPVKPYTTGLPPKRRSPSFVPDTPYPDTVSGVPNTTAEQLTASKDLESLHRSSSSTPTPYQPPSVSIEREQKDSPLQKAPEESLHWSSSSTPTPYQPPSVTIEREQKTSDETIHAIEVGEVSEDTGLTATAPTSRQTNREATGEGSEDTELTAPVPTSRQTNRGATGEESEDTGLTATQLTPHQPCQAALQEAPEYNVGEYLFNCIYSTEEGTDYVSCIPHTSVITVADKKCNSANNAITTPVNVLEVNVPFLDKQAVPNYITNNRFEQGGALGGPEQLTLLQSAEFFEYCSR
ncbi:mucin-5AC-like [Perca flavescens]|uniref:mucin-5AC-like n=1 Tax=Perca flavescens TaxID=8167 RepID=UPI00106E657E|nr:mucin-5AC-like [Perca flavescens]